MENRNYYSLHCLQMETQLIHAYLDILVDIITSLVDVQSQAHTEVSKLYFPHDKIEFIYVEIGIIKNCQLMIHSKVPFDHPGDIYKIVMV